MLSEARGARSLLLVYGGGEQVASLLEELEKRRAEVEAEQAVVIGASPEDRSVRSALEAQNGGAIEGPLAIVTDRFGEIIHIWQGALPDAGAAIHMLQYVTIRCEECFPPEWPPL
jgi:hypothetical protein